MKTEDFDVTIPRLAGVGANEVVSIQVPVIWDEDIEEWILTPEAHRMIDETKARSMGVHSSDQTRSSDALPCRNPIPHIAKTSAHQP